MVRRRAELSGAAVTASSAGFIAEGDAPPQATLDVALRRGLDLSRHESRLVTRNMLVEADLVIGMTRAHVWEAAVLDPEVVHRSFVLGELVRLNESVGRRQVTEKIDDWLARLHAARTDGARPALSADEVPDPFGRRRKVHERVAAHLERLVLELGDCAFDPLWPNSDLRWREARLIWRPE